MKPWMTRWRWLAVVAGASVGATGCGGDETPQMPSVQERAALVSFGGPNACADLEQYIEDTAVQQMRSDLEAMRDEVPNWGWWGSRFGSPEVDAAMGAGPASNERAAPTDYTTTNTQVAGVDEADFVKNDGTRLFVLSGDTLNALRSWPAPSLAVQGTLTIEGYPQEMFLDGEDKAVVFSSVYRQYPLSPAGALNCSPMACGYGWANTVKVTVVDVSDMSDLRVLTETYLPGSYRSARKVGQSVRVVLSDGFNYPVNMRWYPEWTEGLWNNAARRRAAFDQLIADNEVLIRAQTLSDWMPAASVRAGGTTTVVQHPCDRFSRANASTRLGTVTVATLDLASGTLDRNTILGEAGEVYASANNLYVATSHWWWWPAPGQSSATYIHKFDISTPSQARYLASGTVAGDIVDQFSMDESASGQFRVVTTINHRVASLNDPWGRLETTNRLTVLGEQQGALQVVAQSEDLAAGERVMSSRFVDDKAFVVTYRQIDPLFTFDLSDPTKVVKKGELEIPGFSTYMHPLDANHLLTIGVYRPEDQNWAEQTLQLAIFDVSDLAHPRQTHVQKVGSSSSWSEALYEHKAFNYFPARKLLAIPFSDWSYDFRDDAAYWSRFVSDLRVFEVDPVQGFTTKGALSMSDLYQAEHWGNWTYYWTPQVRRSVMADEFVYAITNAGVRVADVADLSTPIASASLRRYHEP